MLYFNTDIFYVGLDTVASTKEDFMFRRSQERVRGYLYKTQDDIKKSATYIQDSKARAKLDTTLTQIKLWLKQVNHFGCYFNRSFFSVRSFSFIQFHYYLDLMNFLSMIYI